MLNTDVLWTKNHPNDVESKGVTGPLKARHPDFGRPAELPLLPPTDRRDGTAESVGRASLNFDKGDGSLAIVSTLARRDEVDVTVPVLESTIRDLPTMYGEPLLRDSFAFESKCLPGC
jgi:hypothetical protein